MLANMFGSHEPKWKAFQRKRHSVQVCRIHLIENSHLCRVRRRNNEGAGGAGTTTSRWRAPAHSKATLTRRGQAHSKIRLTQSTGSRTRKRNLPVEILVIDHAETAPSAN